MRTATSQTGFHLLDALALVVGYGIASMLVRAYWPESEVPTFWSVMMIALVYLWLGLAMSGPVVLLVRRPPEVEPETGVEARPEARTWAELAWMIIGFYWLGLTMLVVPARVHGTRFLDSAILGVFPVIAAIGLRFFGPRAVVSGSGKRAWTHRTGVTLLLTWPFAWVGLIALGKTIL
jgi:hypothetical protein